MSEINATLKEWFCANFDAYRYDFLTWVLNKVENGDITSNMLSARIEEWRYKESIEFPIGSFVVLNYKNATNDGCIGLVTDIQQEFGRLLYMVQFRVTSVDVAGFEARRLVKI